MFKKLVDLHILKEKYSKSSYKEQKFLVKKFIGKYKTQYPELCRYLYYINYLYCRDPERQKYKKSSKYIKDAQIAFTLLYKGFYCLRCGKQAQLLEPKKGNILTASIKPYCSIYCRSHYSAELGAKARTSLPEKRKKEIHDKIINTMLKRYGTRGTLGNKELYNKAKKTLLQRYGVEYISQNKDIKAKAVATFKEKYKKGTEAHARMVQKKKQTCLKHFGYDAPGKNPEISKKIKQSLCNRTAKQKQETLEKTRKTNLQKYGVDNYNKLPAQKENLRNKILKRRAEGNIDFARSKIYSIAGKQIECQSRHEYEFARKLVVSGKYNINDIISQYDPEYDDFVYNKIKTFPDFYIKSKDIYVEVKSPFTFFNTSKEEEYTEERLARNKEKAKRANTGTGITVRWVVCNKKAHHIWRFAFLPKNWWDYSLDYFIKLFKDKHII